MRDFKENIENVIGPYGQDSCVKFIGFKLSFPWHGNNERICIWFLINIKINVGKNSRKYCRKFGNICFQAIFFSPYMKLLLVSPPFYTITNSIVTFGKKIQGKFHLKL